MAKINWTIYAILAGTTGLSRLRCSQRAQVDMYGPHKSMQADNATYKTTTSDVIIFNKPQNWKTTNIPGKLVQKLAGELSGKWN